MIDRAECFQNGEVRRLWISAEYGFYLRQKNGGPPNVWEKKAEEAKETCLRSGVSKNVLSDIVSTAERMALRRWEARKNVFIAASLTRARTTLPYVKFAISVVREQGFRVLSEHNGSDQPIRTFLDQVGNPPTPDDDLHNLFRDTDNEWIMKCGLFIADLTDPSHGVGGEWENCRLKPQLGSFLTPMLGIFLEGTNVSGYIDGIRPEEKPFIRFRSYSSRADLAGVLWEFLGELS